MPVVTIRTEEDLENAPNFEKKLRQKKQGFAKVDAKRKKKKTRHKKGVKK